MTALAADRKVDMKDGELLVVPVAANAVIYAGAIVVANASGYAAPGTTATGLKYIGKAEENVDNTGGANGDKTVKVRKGKAFKWANDGTDTITQAHFMGTSYIVDDQTLANNDGSSTRSAAGVIVGVDSDGVWIQ